MVINYKLPPIIKQLSTYDSAFAGKIALWVQGLLEIGSSWDVLLLISGVGYNNKQLNLLEKDFNQENRKEFSKFLAVEADIYTNLSR